MDNQINLVSLFQKGRYMMLSEFLPFCSLLDVAKLCLLSPITNKLIDCHKYDTSKPFDHLVIVASLNLLHEHISILHTKRKLFQTITQVKHFGTLDGTYFKKKLK